MGVGLVNMLGSAMGKKPNSPPSLGPIGSAGAIIGGQAPADIKGLNVMVKERHNELRYKSKKLQRPVHIVADDVRKLSKFGAFNERIPSIASNPRDLNMDRPVAYPRDAIDDFNFPQIHNLKTDLEDILQRRASYIHNAAKKHKINAIYGMGKKKASMK